jgi:PAS domain S-box-containing protein
MYPHYLNNILDRLNENIIILNKSGNIIYVNKPFVNLLATLGISSLDKIEGQNIWKLLPQLNDTDLYNSVREAIDTKKIKILEWKSVFSDKFWETSVFPFDEGVVAIGRDITERKKTEEVLKESKERLQGILNGVDDGISIVDLSGKVVDCNEASLKLLGLTREEFLGTNVYDIVVPEDRQQAIDGALQVLKKGRIVNQVRVLRKNGSPFWAEISVTSFCDKDKKPIAFIGVTRDISERKSIETELQESEQLYRTLFDKSEEGFILVEPLINENTKEAYDFRFLKVNSAYEHQTGRKISSVQGKKATEIEPNLEKEWISLCGRVAETGQSFRFSNYNKRTDKWYDALYFPFLKGRVGILFTDITKRKKTEEALTESEKKYKQLVDKLPEMVFEIDNRGRVFFANNRALEILGYSMEELGNDFDANRFVAPEDVERSIENMKKMFAGKMRQSNEYTFIRKDGTRFPVLLTSSPIINGEKNIGARGIAVDLTAQKEMERRLKENERLAAIGATAGMVGHDIRNPLQSIAGDLYLIDNDVASLSAGETKRSVQESLASIQANLLYIDKIIADLQDYAKAQKPIFEEVHLEKIIEEVMLLVSIPSELNVVINIEKDFPDFLSDHSMVKRILFNLVNNAVQAMPEGGTLTIGANNGGKKVLICVVDTGTGIPEDIKPKLFSPMVTTKSKGQGFGLAVVKRLVEALSGTVTFESKAGKGTKFTVCLPKNKFIDEKSLDSKSF